MSYFTDEQNPGRDLVPGSASCVQDYIDSGTVRIRSAVHMKEPERVQVVIDTSRFLLSSEIEFITEEIREKLRPIDTEIVFCFDSAIDAVNRSSSLSASALLELWCEHSPQLEPILRRCVFEKRGSEFVIRTPSRYMLALTQTAANEFRSYLGKVYSWIAAISIFADDGLADGMDGAEPIVKRDWHSVKPAVSSRPQRRQPRRLDPQDIIFGKEIMKPEIVRMADLTDRSGRVSVRGELLSVESFTSKKRGMTILTLTVTDRTNTVYVKLFPEEVMKERTVRLLEKARKEPCLLLIRGMYRYDTFARDYCLFADDINRYPIEIRTDDAPEKRVELHLHTQMSAMDATTKLSEVVERAAKWGHKAIAVTDHGVVHSFPEARKLAKKHGVKVIFGCEGYLVPDCSLHYIGPGERYVALAATVSGSGTHSHVFEICAFRFTQDGDEVSEGERFYTPVNPGVPIPPKLSHLTDLTEQQIEDAPTLSEAAARLADFIGDDLIFVHDRETLDVFHTMIDARRIGLSSDCVLTSMLLQYLRRDLSPEQREFGELSAEAAARKTMELALETIELTVARGVHTLPVIDATDAELNKKRSNHIIILAKSEPGLKNLYKLVSYSNLDHFYKTPRIPRSLLNLHRDGLILGSACEAGELFRAMVDGASDGELEAIASFYDYLEVQPIGNNAFLIREGTAKSDDDLREYNRRIVELGERLDKPVVATGDVHFLEPEDAIYRSILMCASNYKDAHIQPPLYFKTTGDMLEEFAYLGSEKAYEIVVKNTNLIADECPQLRPFLDDKQTYAPELPGAQEELVSLCETKAHELYGEVLPEIVQKRIDKEFNSIITNGYSSLYMVAQKLVAKSLSDGYLVGSRGSVGSSFVAYLSGITEVNALPAHYRCPKCRYSEFPNVGDRSRCGIDLPEKDCPVCGTPLKRDGYEIPFETFLGFKGDKTPDIDLNFSGEYQPVAHKFTEVMFGEGHAFRAGTISGLQEKTAYGYVLHYQEEYGLNLSEAEKNRLAQGCVGVRKTTGQHPGGIVIVPDDLEIYDFCPVQHPAEKTDADAITTHFDFHALDDKLVKLDILGHDDPTTIRMLQDITGIDPKSISLADPETMRIFRTDEPLGVSLKELGCDVGSLGISEFGTGFVRGMLMNTRPTTMEELVRIAGLSHGTDVWLGNAEELIKSGTATLMQCICTRDDIMNYLIAHGGEPSLSFKTMESVRKGRGLTPEMEDAMLEHNVPQWYIDSCKKIKYMFPRAHAAAYVMMSFRVAYFKVHYPLAFYSVYFSVRGDAFDIELALGGADKVLSTLRELKENRDADPKQKEQITLLEIVYEMNLRGIELLNVDIYRSKATRFSIEDGKLRPPFNSIAGLGDNAAKQIEEGAKGGEFISREDFVRRTHANSAVMDALDRLGCLEGLPDSNQVRMF